MLYRRNAQHPAESNEHVPPWVSAAQSAAAAASASSASEAAALATEAAAATTPATSVTAPAAGATQTDATDADGGASPASLSTNSDVNKATPASTSISPAAATTLATSISLGGDSTVALDSSQQAASSAALTAASSEVYGGGLSSSYNTPTASATSMAPPQPESTGDPLASLSSYVASEAAAASSLVAPFLVETHTSHPSQTSWPSHTRNTGSPTAAATTLADHATGTGSSATSLAAAPGVNLSNKATHHSSSATLAAAVVVPIIAFLGLGIGLLFWLRRRRRNRAAAASAAATGDTPASASMREKLAAKRAPASLASAPSASAGMQGGPPPQPHLLTSPHNQTYYTGLDTMSMVSTEPLQRLSEEPPPPYRPRSDLARRSVSMRSATGSNTHGGSGSPVSPLSPISATGFGLGLAYAAHTQRPASSIDEEGAQVEDSPFADPPVVGAGAGGAGRGVTRTPSARSITSTLYSSNASVVSARPARVSGVGEAHMVNGELLGRSPFADPESEGED